MGVSTFSYVHPKHTMGSLERISFGAPSFVHRLTAFCNHRAIDDLASLGCRTQIDTVLTRLDPGAPWES